MKASAACYSLLPILAAVAAGSLPGAAADSAVALSRPEDDVEPHWDHDSNDELCNHLGVNPLLCQFLGELCTWKASHCTLDHDGSMPSGNPPVVAADGGRDTLGEGATGVRGARASVSFSNDSSARREGKSPEEIKKLWLEAGERIQVATGESVCSFGGNEDMCGSLGVYFQCTWCELAYPSPTCEQNVCSKTEIDRSILAVE